MSESPTTSDPMIRRSNRPAKVALAALAVLGLLATAGLFAITISKKNREIDRLQRAADVENDDRMALELGTKSITVDQANRPVPNCSNLTGTAPDIGGTVLWAAHRLKTSNSVYYFRKVDRKGADGWYINRWTIGGQSTEADYGITLFYIDEAHSAVLDELNASKNPTFSLKQLPAPLATSAEFIVQRHLDADGTCAGTKAPAASGSAAPVTAPAR
jgi:hypothetical protein